MHATADDEVRDLLDHDPIAVVGCSTTAGKAAHDIPSYMRNRGYEVIPVNPFADAIFGETAYDSLADVPEDIAMVNVFRPSEEVPEIVDDVLARHENDGDVEALWLQLGITHDEATDRAVEAGLDVVQDRCLKVEHQRLD